MNKRRTQRDIPRTLQNTNLAGGRGRGCSPCLGIKTFNDELVSMVNYSIGAQNQGPSSMRRSPVSPRLEASLSTVERTMRAATPSSIRVEGTLGDRGSSVGLGGPDEVYQIDREELKKEEWLQF